MSFMRFLNSVFRRACLEINPRWATPHSRLYRFLRYPLPRFDSSYRDPSLLVTTSRDLVHSFASKDLVCLGVPQELCQEPESIDLVDCDQPVPITMPIRKKSAGSDKSLVKYLLGPITIAMEIYKLSTGQTLGKLLVRRLNDIQQFSIICLIM